MNEYYVYMLIDPRTDKPFYIGKGKGRRCSSHVAEARNTTRKTRKLNKIRKIESSGQSVVIKKVEVNVTDETAKELEMFIISECRSFGIDLTNQTEGGDGSSGYKHTPDSLRKISESQRGKPKPDSQKQRLAEYVKANNPMHREDVVKKTSGERHWAFGKPAANKGKKWSDDQRKRQSEAFSGENHPFYGNPCSESRREAISKATIGIKKSTTINMKKPKKKEQCPHCGKLASGGNLARWHNDNCKEKS